jgi:hypothetical protein
MQRMRARLPFQLETSTRSEPHWQNSKTYTEGAYSPSEQKAKQMIYSPE